MTSSTNVTTGTPPVNVPINSAKPTTPGNPLAQPPHAPVGGFRRDYISVLACAQVDREVRMKRTVDMLWEAFHHHGLSWVGFYVFDSDAPAGQELVLEECRDKPACSPIGLHGCCGRSYTERRPLIVNDVRTLGPNYIACDPADMSEAVVPLFNPDGSCWGVLDVDSHHIGAFEPADIEGLIRVLEMMGLSAPRTANPADVIVL